MRIYICHASSYDYKTELYEPIKASELYQDHDIFLPHEPEHLNTKTSDIIDQFDLMIGEVSYPSTGQGIEIGLAAAAAVPVACIYKASGKPASLSLRFYSQQMLSYADADNLIAALNNIIAETQVAN